MRSALVIAVVWLFSVGAAGWASSASLPDDATLRGWVAEMKVAERGPFHSIGWFCEDGSVRGAKQGCGEHGGGIQHGRWNERSQALRDGGFLIANVMAEVEPAELIGPAGRPALEQILLERFLVAADDGWVLRAARSYRGALQAEDEEEGTRKLLAAMLVDPTWRSAKNFFVLREAARYLPRQPVPGDVSAADVRNSAAWIARKDAGFRELRVKIHGQPDSGDAARVRAYAAARGRKSVGTGYVILAGKIDRLYLGGEAAADVEALARVLPEGSFRTGLLRGARALAEARDPEQRLALTSRLLTRLRLNALRFADPTSGLAFLDTSLSLEDATYAAGNELLERVPFATRRRRLGWLKDEIGALYGGGLLSVRQAAALQQSLRDLLADPTIATYREEVAYLARAPEWAARRLRFEMGAAVAHFRRLDPMADRYLQDRLRGSPFLFYGAIVDSLAIDAHRLAGVSHRLFGVPVGVGLRGLNPGLARGVLRIGQDLSLEEFRSDGIYLLPETTAELPPVAGILTEGEGSSLSHIQLLARNLGIPNVVVADDLAASLRSYAGEKIVVAVSPGGVVQIEADGRGWDAFFAAEEATGAVPAPLRLEPDLEKLDLEEMALMTLDDLRARDAGRIVGPKSANLGELRRYFGERVPQGVVIPFGVFRSFLAAPIEPGGPEAFVWLKRQYDVLPWLKDDPGLQNKTARLLLARIREFILTAEFPAGFEDALRTALRSTFGASGTYGVFVRSDTNVEDLPGFTGAGLNRTVPNAVGEDAIVAAVRRVWASPFSERAYAWRQAYMKDPEWVFPAVLIQKAFPSEKSGVMVTTDVAGGRPGYITLAVNEGIGGAVDGQAAESLLVRESDGHTRLLGEAAQRERRELDPAGGLRTRPTSLSLQVLTPAEIRELLTLASEARKDFPALQKEDGGTFPADIEFGVAGGTAVLLQIRPFLENSAARSSAILGRLDGSASELAALRVDLDAVPGSPVRAHGAD
ncbi:MAG: PEP/pyruvate-binding domain-containing protein [Deltaproteobacteria bacterium]